MKWTACIVWALALVFLTVMSGCASEPTPEDSTLYSPTPELAEATQRAIDRINAAAGLSLRVGPGGVSISRGDAEGACGVTLVTEKRLKPTVMTIAAGVEFCSNDENTIAHEIIHALRGFDACPQGCKDDHTRERGGLFAARATEDMTIDEATLIKICEVAACTDWKPES